MRVAIIPVKRGSKEIPRKNIKLFWQTIDKLDNRYSNKLRTY